MTRYDGVIPGQDFGQSLSPRDPREKNKKLVWLTETLDLPIPRFVIDEHYIGDPPKVEVTFENLNDNIDKQFLGKTLIKHAEWDDVQILYHPATHKHLGNHYLIIPIVKLFSENEKGARCI